MNIRPIFFALIWMVASAVQSKAAPALSLSADSLLMNHIGYITNLVTGLAAGETVTFERVADLNENGQADAGEPSLRTFKVTDGIQPILGGALVNRNEPGDDNLPGTGTIQVNLPFNAIDAILGRQAGKYIIRATGPSGEASKPFAITQPSFPQRVTGFIKNSADNSNVPFAMIVVLVGDGDPIGSCRANASGEFSFNAPPGDYGLVPFASGYASTFQSVSIPADETVVQNLTLTPGTVQISGTVKDAGNGAGLPAVFVLAQSEGEDSILSGGLTDGTGSYSLSVPAGTFEVRALSEFTSQLGYVGYEEGNIVTAGSTPITLDFTALKATSAVYGRVTDQNGAPISDLKIRARQRTAASLEANGRTTPEGDYVLALTPGDWEIQTDGADALGFRSETFNISVGSNSAVLTNFTLGRITAHVRGRVVDANGVGISGVFFHGHFGNSNDGSSGMTTSEDGSFDISVWGGEWYFHIGDDANARGLIDFQYKLTVVDGVDQTITFIVAAPSGSISGFVRNSSGQGLPAISVFASASINGVIYQSSTNTDASGHYALPVINGSWSLSVTCDDFFPTYNCPMGTFLTINNNNAAFDFTATPPVVNQPHLLNPRLDRSGGNPIFEMTISGDPGTYQIEASAGIPFSWNVISAHIILAGQNSTLARIDPGQNRFFRAKAQ